LNLESGSKTSLYVVPTPIGNLKDITLRALQIFKDVDLILAEDTRKTSILLKHYEIEKPLKSFHAHNEHRIVNSIIEDLKQGKTMAQVSDAGTPGISDPGYLLVRECLKNGLSVECLPGPTAFIPALIKSGFPIDRFVYEGFLPHKKGRKKRIESLKNCDKTTVIYESPHRLMKLLDQLIEILGEDRQVSISRELSKIFEETINGSLGELKSHFCDKIIKGEIVIVLAGVET